MPGDPGTRITLDDCIWSPEGMVEMETTFPLPGRRSERYGMATPMVSRMKSTEPRGMTVCGSDLV
jgi:hypothetical protein